MENLLKHKLEKMLIFDQKILEVALAYRIVTHPKVYSPLFIVEVRTIQIIVGISNKALNKMNPCRIRTLPTGFDT